MVSMTITSKVRLYPTDIDAVHMNDTMHTYTKVCNFISNWVFEHKELAQRKIHDALYYDVRDKFKLNSQLTQSAIKTVIAKYKSTHANLGKKWTVLVNFKKHQLDLVFNRNYALLAGDIASISTNAGRVKVPFTVNGVADIRSDNVKLGTAKLVFKHGNWFLHIPVTLDVTEYSMADIANIVGIDMGINFLITTYNSVGKTGFVSGKQVKQKRAYFKQLRAQLQRKGTASARKRLLAIGQRENRWMSDVNHQVSKALVTSLTKPSLLVLEDLTGVRNCTEKVRRKNRYVQVSWAYFQLGQFIDYKARLAGHRTVAVDPAHTSQQCPKCGHTERNNRNKRTHVFKCKKCGYTSNDDRVAAMNLYDKGIKYRMQTVSSMTGYC